MNNMFNIQERIKIYIIYKSIIQIQNKILIIYPKYLREEEKEIFNFLKNDKNIESFRIFSPPFHLEGWSRHFEHEYIIKLSKIK